MKILCIDGGGIFGVIPSYMLSRMRLELPEFQAYGGTSIGSIIASSYAIGKSYASTHEFFVDASDDIFHRSFLSRLNPLKSSKYPAKGIDLSLKKWFGNRVMRNVKPHLIIPTYDFKNGKPKIFDNLVPTSDMDKKVWEMCRMSSAAPTYFPPYQGMIDGGIIANNPVVVTAWALHSKLGIPYGEMEILSIGTGFRKTERKGKIHTKAGWLNPMLEMLTDGNEQVANFGAKQIGIKKYVRFNPVPLEKGWDMDQKNLIPELETLCCKYVEDFAKAIKTFNEGD